MSKKMIVGRRVEYLETYEIDMSKFSTIRDDLDFCQRILWAADPVLTQKIKIGTSNGIKLLSKFFDRISENPIYPIPKCYSEKGIFENE